MNKKKYLIKVCGMTSVKNIGEMALLDIDFIGMIFYPKSPRFVCDPIDVEVFDQKRRVGVFVNPQLHELSEIANRYKLDAVQLHGSESPDFCREVQKLNVSVFKAFGVDKDFDFNSLSTYSDVVDLFVFDSKSKNYGGSGVKFDWTVLDNYRGNKGFLLGGGLRYHDLPQLVKIEHSMLLGFDLNSGFELSPGLKDADMIKNFVNELKK